jgi:hypothetical protein
MVAKFSWEYSFLIAATLTIPLTTSLYLMDNKYLDLYGALQHRKDCRTKVIQELKANARKEK